jgi:hypothetical protein
LALAAHGKPLTFSVAEGVPLDTFKYIDGGKPRTLADLMSITGTPLGIYPRDYATAGYMLYKGDSTGDPRVKPDAANMDGTGAILDIVKAEYADDMVSVMTRHRPALLAAARNKMGAVSLWMYFMVQMESADKLLAAKVMRYVSEYGAIEPCSKNLYFAAKLTEKLRKKHEDPVDGTVKKARYKDFLDGLMGAWALAWNLTREGKHLKSQATFNAQANLAVKNWPGIK